MISFIKDVTVKYSSTCLSSKASKPYWQISSFLLFFFLFSNTGFAQERIFGLRSPIEIEIDVKFEQFD